MPGPIVAAGLSILGGVANNVWNASEARKNRQFQERMSSTAHQREVADLKSANINSAWRSMSGASTPGGDRAQMDDVVGKGVSSAMSAKQMQQMQAQIELTRNQGNTAKFDALIRQQDWLDRQGNPTSMSPGAAIDLDVKRMNQEQLREALPLALQKAREEISQLSSSAEAAKARAALDRAAHAGAINEQEFQRMMGQAAPWLRNVLLIIRSIR